VPTVTFMRDLPPVASMPSVTTSPSACREVASVRISGRTFGPSLSRNWLCLYGRSWALNERPGRLALFRTLTGWLTGAIAKGQATTPSRSWQVGFVLRGGPSAAGRWTRQLALFSAPAPRPQATPCPPSTRQSRLALFSIVGTARVEGVSPSDRRQDARDTIGFVSHDPSPAACSLLPASWQLALFGAAGPFVVTPQGVSWQGCLGLVLRQLVLFRTIRHLMPAPWQLALFRTIRRLLPAP
jgi:hypothetical protein